MQSSSVWGSSPHIEGKTGQILPSLHLYHFGLTRNVIKIVFNQTNACIFCFDCERTLIYKT